MPDSRPYTVQPGDCMASIAAEAGFPWQTIWDFAANSDLKKKRKSPFTLVPGDVVTIPPTTERLQNCPTDKSYKFVLKTEPEFLILHFLDENDKPLANQPFQLEIDGAKFSGQTDGAGELKQQISPTARKGHVTVGSGARRREYYLQLGFVQPIDTISGGQGRLYDLGYYDGQVDGQLTGQTRAAILIFQTRYKIEKTGEYDTPTQDKLKEVFGS